MATVYINELGRHVGQSVTLRGWVVTTRSSGKIAFLVVRDGTGYLQAVFARKEVSDAVWEAFARLTHEASVAVTGTVREDARSPGGFELTASDLVILGPSPDFPISPKEHGTQFLFEHRHLWLRSRRQAAIARVRHVVVQAIHDFFDQRGFTHVDTPILTGSIGEQAGELFATEYFDLGKAYLAQTGQLYGEAAAAALGKIYCFGPTFRAEKSKTRRHLTEFWMVEPEVAYANLDDIMDLAEDFIVAIVKHVLERCRPELEVLERDVSKLERVEKPFPRMSYREAAALIREKGLPFEEGNDFGAPDETAISEHFDRPVLIHRYPSAVKAFYMKRDPEDEKFALCVDVIAPEGVGEIIGGGQREDDLSELEKRIEEHKLPREPFEWFLDLRRYGTVPHAGFGLGLERTVAWLCGTEHVRECIPFPRMLYRIYP